MNLPHPFLPQMRLGNVEFGEGEYEVGMNIFINTQVEIVFPPIFGSLFCANGGTRRGKIATP